VHPAAEVAIVMRPEGQVEVVGHQAVGQDAHRRNSGSSGALGVIMECLAVSGAV
jgi:hypothetical protein